MTVELKQISIEVTRRCNLKCRHCCRGNAQNKDIDFRYIDILLDQVSYIQKLYFTGGEPTLNVPAMKYFVDGCKKRGIRFGFAGILTNGIKITQDFVDVCYEVNELSDSQIHVAISADQYHTEQRDYDLSLLSELPFLRILGRRIDVMAEGRGKKLPESNYKAKTATYGYNAYSVLTLNVLGEIINGCDWSYANQKYHKVCNVEGLGKFIEKQNKVRERILA